MVPPVAISSSPFAVLQTAHQTAELTSEGLAAEGLGWAGAETAPGGNHQQGHQTLWPGAGPSLAPGLIPGAQAGQAAHLHPSGTYPLGPHMTLLTEMGVHNTGTVMPAYHYSAPQQQTTVPPSAHTVSSTGQTGVAAPAPAAASWPAPGPLTPAAPPAASTHMVPAQPQATVTPPQGQPQATPVAFLPNEPTEQLRLIIQDTKEELMAKGWLYIDGFPAAASGVQGYPPATHHHMFSPLDMKRKTATSGLLYAPAGGGAGASRHEQVSEGMFVMTKPMRRCEHPAQDHYYNSPTNKTCIVHKQPQHPYTVWTKITVACTEAAMQQWLAAHPEARFADEPTKLRRSKQQGRASSLGVGSQSSGELLEGAGAAAAAAAAGPSGVKRRRKGASEGGSKKVGEVWAYEYTGRALWVYRERVVPEHVDGMGGLIALAASAPSFAAAAAAAAVVQAAAAASQPAQQGGGMQPAELSNSIAAGAGAGTAAAQTATQAQAAAVSAAAATMQPAAGVGPSTATEQRSEGHAAAQQTPTPQAAAQDPASAAAAVEQSTAPFSVPDPAPLRAALAQASINADSVVQAIKSSDVTAFTSAFLQPFSALSTAAQSAALDQLCGLWGVSLVMLLAMYPFVGEGVQEDFGRCDGMCTMHQQGVHSIE